MTESDVELNFRENWVLEILEIRRTYCSFSTKYFRNFGAKNNEKKSWITMSKNVSCFLLFEKLFAAVNQRKYAGSL